MCRECKGLACNSRFGCPDFYPRKVGNCAVCKDNICEGDEYYDVDGESVCEDCFWEYANKEFKTTAVWDGDEL